MQRFLSRNCDLFGTAGKFTERSLITLLEETLALIKNDHGSRISSAEGIDLIRCFPPDLNASGLPKVENFLQHRIHRTGPNLVP